MTKLQQAKQKIAERKMYHLGVHLITHRPLRNDGANYLTIPGIQRPKKVKTWCEEAGMIDGVRVVNQYYNAIRDYLDGTNPDFKGYHGYQKFMDVLSSKVPVYDNSLRGI